MFIKLANDGRVGSKEFLLISHRGGRGFGPENTLESLKGALDFGVEMVETDVRMSRDGVPFIHHSPFLGIHLLSHMNMSEIRERAPGIPTLEEYLDLAGHKCALNLEVKRCDAQILAEVINWSSPSSPILISSFDAEFLFDFKATGSPLEVGLLTQYELDNARVIEETTRCGANTLLPVSFYARENLIHAAHEAGLRIISWTVNNTSSLVNMIQMGADGIITDCYDDLDEFLESRVIECTEGEMVLMLDDDSSPV